MITVIISISLMLVGIACSYWQYRRASTAKKNLQRVFHRLPIELLDNVSPFLVSETDFRETRGLRKSVRQLHTSYADLDGDGNEELLVHVPYGAHGAVVQVYGFRNRDFRLIDEINTNMMPALVVHDFDNDGRLELITEEVSLAADLPFVLGFRDVVFYRLEEHGLVEVKRTNLYSLADLKTARREHAAQVLVSMEQLLENASNANEQTVLDVVKLLKYKDEDATEHDSVVMRATDALQRLKDFRRDLYTHDVIGELSKLSADKDEWVRSTARAILGRL